MTHGMMACAGLHSVANVIDAAPVGAASSERGEEGVVCICDAPRMRELQSTVVSERVCLVCASGEWRAHVAAAINGCCCVEVERITCGYDASRGTELRTPPSKVSRS